MNKNRRKRTADFNPIEKMWGEIKSLLRGTDGECAGELSEAITQAFKAIIPEDAQGWFFSCRRCLLTTPRQAS